MSSLVQECFLVGLSVDKNFLNVLTLNFSLNYIMSKYSLILPISSSNKSWEEHTPATNPIDHRSSQSRSDRRTLRQRRSTSTRFARL